MTGSVAGFRGSLEERFDRAYTITENGCWLWVKGKYSAGYGSISKDGRSVYAHRVSYERFVGEIPADTELDHLCRNRECVNPEHLEPVSHMENIERGEWVPRKGFGDLCRKGLHILTKENTYIYHAKGRKRESMHCLDCRKLRRGR